MKQLLFSERVLINDRLFPAGVLIVGQSIKAIIPPAEIDIQEVTHNYGNCVIMPSLIDAHVHVNEPGRTDWEGFETATKSAAAGGITAIADMPLNSSPVTTTVAALEEKKKSGTGKLFVDCTCYGGLIPDNADNIEPLLKSGMRGIKTFLCHSGIDEFPNTTEEELRKAMPVIAKYGIPLLVHAELTDDVQRFDKVKPGDYKNYAQSRPQEWEVNAIKLILNLCREYRCPVHIVHLAASDVLPLIESAKNDGLPVTVETAPHYLYFDDDTIPNADTRYKCAPPIRNAQNRNKLRNALNSGIIDFVATDHSPAPPDMKELDSGDLGKAWGGISSHQLLLPALWTSMKKSGAKIADISKWTSQKPAQFLGIDDKTGKFKEGYEANITVWSPEESFVVDEQKLHHKHKITPYDGETLYGKIKATWLRGKQVFSDGDIFSAPKGRWY